MKKPHNLVDFLLLEAYELFFHYIYGKQTINFPISSMLEINYKYPPTALKSGSGPDEQLIIIGLSH